MIPAGSVNITGMDVCVREPNVRQRLLMTAAVFPGQLMYAVLFLGLYLLLRIARREGVFAPRVGRMLGRLGIVIAVCAVPATMIGNVSRLAFIETVRAPGAPGGHESVWGAAVSDILRTLPIGFLLIACALITAGRIFRYGSTLEGPVEPPESSMRETPA